MLINLDFDNLKLAEELQEDLGNVQRSLITIWNYFSLNMTNQFSSIFTFLYIQKRNKGLINVVVAGPQDILKQHLIINEEQPSFSKSYTAHFGEVSTM